MNRFCKRAILIFVLFGFPLCFPFNESLAQTGISTIEIAQVDNANYPEVTLYLRILDENGDRVPNLTQEQFSVTEDGTGVEVVEFNPVNWQPILTVLVIDISGSMEGEKLSGAKAAASTFIDLMRDQDQAGLIVFNDRVTVRQGFTADKALLKQEIQDLSESGKTAWYDAVVQAVNQIESRAGRKSIILLSDGLDNRSQNSFTQALEVARDSQVPVYTIGLGQPGDYDASGLQDMANKTGGRFYATPSASQLGELYSGLSQATQEEYVVTYRSPRPSYDGTRRDIVVSVGTVSVGGDYLEAHLLNIESDPLVGALCLIPLLFALLIPSGVNYLKRQVGGGEPALPPESGVPLQPAGGSPKVPSPAPSHVCIHCGAGLRPGARFCNACGKPQDQGEPPARTVVATETVFCRYCGNQLQVGMKFCNKCGKQTGQ
jgi:VWFA-related protein